MANGVNVTDKGMQFLVSIDGSQAMDQLRQLQSSMKGLATEIEKSVGLTQKSFNKTFDALGELVKELDKNPGVGTPGAASKDAVKFAQKLNQELEKQRKKMNDGFVEARQGISNLNKETTIFNNSVEALGDDIGEVNEKLTDMIGFGPQLKGMLAGFISAFGIDALIENTVELDEQLFRLGQRFGKTKDEIFASSKEAASGVNTTVAAMNRLIAISADAGNNNLELATSFGELSTKMSQVFGVEASNAQATLEALRQKGIATTEKSAKSLGDSFVVIQKQFGTSFDQMAESIGRNSEALSKMRENMIRLGQSPEAAEKSVQKLGAQLLVIESTFREVGGMSEGMAQSVTNSLAKINIDPLSAEFSRLKHIIGSVDGDSQALEKALSKLAKGDAMGMVELFDQLDESTEKMVLNMPADYLQKLFGGTVSDVRALIANIQRMKEGGTSLAEEMEKYNKRMAEAKESGEILDEAVKEWEKTVGGAWNRIYTQVGNVFASISNIVREPLAAFLNDVGDILELFGKMPAALQAVGAALAALGLKKLAGFGVKALVGKALGMGGKQVGVPGGGYIGLPDTATRSATFGEKIRMNLRSGAKKGGALGAVLGGVQAISDIKNAYEEEGGFGEKTTQAAITGGASVVGGIAGGALGSAFGPIGTMIGAELGASLGKWAANFDWAGFGESLSKWAESMGVLFESVFIDPAKEGLKSLGEGIKNTFKSFVDWLVEAIQKIPGFNAAMSVTGAVVEGAGALIDTASEIYNYVAGDEDSGGTVQRRSSSPPPVGTSVDKESPLLTTMPVGLTVQAPVSQSNESGASIESDNKNVNETSAIVEGLERLAQGQEKQTQTMSQIAVSQANASRVGGNPSASATRLQSIGNGAA